MSLKSQSLFRFATAKERKGESYDGMRMADASATSPSIAASGKWVAAGVGENKGNVAVYPIKFENYQKKADGPVIGAHTGPLADLAFSTFNSDLLATAGKDNLVKLWNIPSGGLVDSTLSASATWGEFEGLTSLAWHPTAEGVLAAGGRKSVAIFDANDTKTPKYSYSLDGFNKDILSVSWNYNGSSLAAVAKNNVCHIIDPRTADAKTAIEGGHALGDLKPQCALYVSNTTYSLLLLGLDKMRNPMFSFYDTRSMGKAVDSKSLSFSTGFLLPMYDIDTELLMIGVRGSAQLSFFDMSQGALDACGSYSFKTGLKGATIARKQGVDIYNQEINRVFGLTDKSIEAATMTVPRKSPGFHIELYPPTAEVGTATMSADAWYKGGNENPKLYQITDKIADAKQAKEVEVVQQKQAEAVAKKEDARTYKTTNTRAQLEAHFANSVFKHTKGLEPNSKDLMYYMLQTFGKTLNLSRNIRTNATNFAFPWKTVGGSALCVVPISRVGRCSDSPPLVRGHKSQFNCFDLSQFDHNLVVTGGDEGKALVYRLPEGGMKDDVEKHAYEIETDGKVGYVRFHPYAANIVITASTTVATGTQVQFWPLGADPKPAPKLTLPNHKEPVYDVAVGPDAYTVATSSRDAKVRLFDARDGGKQIGEFEPAEGQRDTQIVWVNTHTLITIGFGKMSRRTMSLWDTKDFKAPLKTVELSSSNAAPLAHYDEDSCILFLANHGGRIMSTYNVTPKSAPYIDQLNEWMTPSDMIGWAFFPKTVCDVRKVEIARCLKLTKDSVVPVSFTVPRKRMEYYQDDIFVATRSPDAWFTGDEWFSGSQKEQTFVTMQPAGMLELSKAPKEELTEAQKKYQNNLEAMAKAKEQQVKGATGHTNSTQVQKYFSQVATTMPTKNRWDAAVDNSRTDVDESEW